MNRRSSFGVVLGGFLFHESKCDLWFLHRPRWRRKVPVPDHSLYYRIGEISQFLFLHFLVPFLNSFFSYYVLSNMSNRDTITYVYVSMSFESFHN